MPRPPLAPSDFVHRPGYAPILEALGYEFMQVPQKSPQTFSQVRAHLESRGIKLRRQEVLKRLRRLERAGLVREEVIKDKNGGRKRGRAEWRLTEAMGRATALAMRDAHLGMLREWAVSPDEEGSQVRVRTPWAPEQELVVHGVPEGLLPRVPWDPSATREDWNRRQRIQKVVEEVLQAGEKLLDILYEKDTGYRKTKQRGEILRARRNRIVRRIEERLGIPPWGDDLALTLKRWLMPMEVFSRLGKELDSHEVYEKLGGELWETKEELRRRGFGISLLLPSGVDWLLYWLLPPEKWAALSRLHGRPKRGG